MARNHYSYEKRQQELKKKKKREAMLRGEPFGDNAEEEEGEESETETVESDPEVS